MAAQVATALFFCVPESFFSHKQFHRAAKDLDGKLGRLSPALPWILRAEQASSCRRIKNASLLI